MIPVAMPAYRPLLSTTGLTASHWLQAPALHRRGFLEFAARLEHLAHAQITIPLVAQLQTDAVDRTDPCFRNMAVLHQPPQEQKGPVRAGPFKLATSQTVLTLVGSTGRETGRS